MLKGDAKTAYQREYMRQRQAAAKARQTANGGGRETEAQPAAHVDAEAEAEVEPLRAENQRLEEEIARLGGLPRTAEGLKRARLAGEERKRAEREAGKQAPAAAPVDSPEACKPRASG